MAVKTQIWHIECPVKYWPTVLEESIAVHFHGTLLTIELKASGYHGASLIFIDVNLILKPEGKAT